MAKGKKTGGRKAGTPNKATLEIKEAARQYAPDALQRLHQIMLTGESDAAKVSAAREILDRAYGKPSQAIKADVEQTFVRAPGMDNGKKVLERYINKRALDVLDEIGFSINRAKSFEENLQEAKLRIQKIRED